MSPPPPKVLILDGNQRSALAATRALGRHDIPVVVAEESRWSLAGSSRYCKETFGHPSPTRDSGAFLERIQQEVNARGIGILMPMTETTAFLLNSNRQRFLPAVIPFPTPEDWDSLTDKCQLFHAAAELSIPFPTTLYPSSPKELEDCVRRIGYPLVIKPCKSKFWDEATCTSTTVHIVNDPDQLSALIQSRTYLRDHPFCVQEYVPGTGQGLFALYNHGQPVAFFGHRRLREKPPGGGVSVLSESVSLRPDLKSYAARLLGSAKWHGVAMVEFRIARDGAPYLMEVNPRFWGSLQLAIDSGLDFPYLLYQLARGDAINPPAPYRIGVRSRWLLGDLDRLYLVLRGKTSAPLSVKVREVLQFLKLLDAGTHYEVNRFSDLRPFIFELRNYLAHLLHRKR